MIDAKKARQKSLINSELKNKMENIEKEIIQATDEGFFGTTVRMLRSSDEVANVICKELTDLGYEVEYEHAKPLPSGCPSDQWDFYDHLHIRWDPEKGE